MEQKIVDINGTKYTLQKPDVKSVVGIRSRILNSGLNSQLVAYEEYMQHIVVKPKITWEEFEGKLDVLDKIMFEAEEFLYGGKK